MWITASHMGIARPTRCSLGQRFWPWPCLTEPSWESEAVHPGGGTLVFPSWAALRPKPQVLTAPAHACPPGSAFSLEVFVCSALHSSLCPFHFGDSHALVL